MDIYKKDKLEKDLSPNKKGTNQSRSRSLEVKLDNPWKEGVRSGGIKFCGLVVKRGGSKEELELEEEDARPSCNVDECCSVT